MISIIDLPMILSLNIVFMISSIIYSIIIVYLILFLINYFKGKVFIDSKGKAVLITGCDSGFGNSLAKRLNELGFRVYATVLDTECRGAKQLSESAKYCDQMIVFKMNVTIDEEIKNVYKYVCNDLENSGHQLWTVVNNAGYMISAKLEWGTLDEFRNLFEVNVFGVLNVTRTFLPLIKISKGRVVNLGSVMGEIATNSFGAYCMSKSAVISFTHTLRREMQRFGVNVIMISPGAYRNTNLFESCSENIDKIWNETDDHVKDSYGFDAVAKTKQMYAWISSSALLDLTPITVVNDMIDSIVNAEPRLVYKPIEGIIPKIIWYSCFYLPNNVTDILNKLVWRDK